MSVELGVVVGIGLAVACALAVILPLRAAPPRPSEDYSNRSDLLARRESAFQVLRDLDSDFEAGKLAEEDYRPMRVQALAQAAEIMAQLDAAQAPVACAPKGGAKTIPAGQAAPAVKTFLSHKRARQEAADQFCGKCGAARAADDQFCRKCGAPLA